jgi:cysteine desulfurase
MRELRDRLEREVLARVPASRVNGGEAPRVPNTSNLAFAGVTGEVLVMALDLEGIAVSAGSACSAGTVRKSHVLEAMGLGEAAGSSIRISLGPGTTAAEIDCVVRLVAQVVDRVRAAAVAPAGRP